MPVNVSITSNVAAVSRKVQALPPQQGREIMTVLNTDLLDVLRDSKTKPPRVPVDTGALQSSGFTEPAKQEGLKIVAAIGYGGVGNVDDYASIVHDNLSGRIKNYKRPGSGPKFLEIPLMARQKERTESLEHALGMAWERL